MALPGGRVGRGGKQGFGCNIGKNAILEGNPDNPHSSVFCCKHFSVFTQIILRGTLRDFTKEETKTEVRCLLTWHTSCKWKSYALNPGCLNTEPAMLIVGMASQERWPLR